MSRTVVITGACGGIGQATVRRFAADGWRTIGLDRTDPPDELALDHYLHCDVSSVEELRAAVADLLGEERIDALVNNAATGMDAPFDQLTVEQWDLTMDTNVRPAFLLTQGLLPPLAANGGAVVNVASVHAVATSRGVAAYAASKGALVALTRASSLDLADAGIRCNAVCPGATDTAMLHAGMSGARGMDGDPLGDLIGRTPAGRIGAPEEIAEAILFLADSDRSGFITGQSLVVDGGATTRLGTE
jgi:NAD(P)-dependent dehydrogenase (short-subunit alcohol dehydrogenase family)